MALGELWHTIVVFLVDLLVGLHSFLAGAGLNDIPLLGRIGLSSDLSWGFTIILFTLVMRTLTAPFNVAQIRSSKAMQVIQPQIKELQKKYGKDREKLMQEQMRLYRENKINPMLGCLPMLIQMPVWIALYQALYSLANNFEIYNFTGGFLWLQDLGKPEGFPQVLAVLTGVTQWIVQRMMTPRSTDSQQAAMNNAMQFMPLMFIFFAFSVPSGLVIYWVTSNLFSMGQQYLMMGWGSLLPLPWQSWTNKRRAVVQLPESAANGRQLTAGNAGQLPAEGGTLRVASGDGLEDPYRGPGGGKKKKSKRRR